MTKTALISVYNKEGIADFAKELLELGWDILASGGTAKILAEAHVPVRDISELAGGGAILDHRVVTLSREVHAALLATDSAEDREELLRLSLPRIDLVCVDLYPLEEEINLSRSTKESVIAKTDIGGPALLRSAAKGRRIVICSPEDRVRLIEWLKSRCPNRQGVLDSLAAKAEALVSQHCLASARYHSKGEVDGFVETKLVSCLYGENPWQKDAALFGADSDDPLALDGFKLVGGASPSYNNLCDLDRLLQTTTHIAAAFDAHYNQVPFIAVGAKHGNACGAAVGLDREDVLKKMIAGDAQAIFGAVVMMNFPVNESAAEVLLTHLMPKGQRRLLDGIIAPSFGDEAMNTLKRKGDKCRFFINPALSKLGIGSLDSAHHFRYARGGFLWQGNYTFILDLKDEAIEKYGDITPEQENDIALAWAVGSTSNSNTITLVRERQLIGNGVGQQDRVGGCELAVKRARDAGHSTEGAVAYSDSFFPFTDGPEILAKAGISVILSSSGSVRDEEVKKFCREHNLTLYLIPDRIGRGFFGH